MGEIIECISHLGLLHHLSGLLGLSILDVEETDLVRGLGGGDDTEPVTELLLLKELLDQVLEVTLGEGSLGLNDDLGLLASDLDGLSELTSLTVNLDAGLQEVGEVIGVDDLLSSVALNGELDLSLLSNLLLQCFNITPIRIHITTIIHIRE